MTHVLPNIQVDSKLPLFGLLLLILHAVISYFKIDMSINICVIHNDLCDILPNIPKHFPFGQLHNMLYVFYEHYRLL